MIITDFLHILKGTGNNVLVHKANLYLIYVLPDIVKMLQIDYQ